MKAAFFFFFYCTLSLAACSQQEEADAVPVVVQHPLPAGDVIVRVQQTSFATDLPYFLVHLHGNEATALQAAEWLAGKKGIALFQIQNSGERLIPFQLDDKWFRFDPNRIFSDEGIRQTLTLLNPDTGAAFVAVKQFRDSLLSLLDHSKTIITVHNNTDKRFSILHYKNAGTSRVHVNEQQDVDDFFLTNDAELFEQLKAADFNVVLEDPSSVEEDGSLSLHCSRKGIRYVNVEAEHGHLQQQTEMLCALLQILR